LFSAVPASAQAQADQNRSVRVEGELLIKLRDGPHGPGADRARAAFGHDIRRRYDRVGWQHIRVPPGLATDEALVRFRQHSDVLAVEPNQAGRTTAATVNPASPDDPQFTNQWALAKISAPAAWHLTTGSTEVVVAVIDTGVNYNHEDLRDNMWRNPGEIPGNGVDDDGNGFIDDVFGIDTANDSQGNDADPFDRGASGYYHGSAVAGIIGAVGNNRLGLAGVNWSVRIMALRAIRSSDLITVADELEAFEYILEMKSRGVNVRVVNMSYGKMPYSLAERDGIAALGTAGILVCAAAGNDGEDNDSTPFYPAGHPLTNIIAVAGTDPSDRLATFPNIGLSNFGRNTVDLAAPGVAIATTFGPATNSYLPDFAGTSAATPHVAGAVALLAAANPIATPAQIKAALLASVDLVPALTNKMVSHGRLNLLRAMDHPFIASGPPVIARQPESLAVVISNTATLSALPLGGRPREFQWLLNGEPVPGATNNPLIISNAQFTHAGNYALVVSNPAGVVTSAVAVLNIVPLKITTQPASQMVRPGTTVTFSIAANGPSPLSYQWRFNSSAISGATNATLRLTNVQLTNDGVYSVSVANRFGVVESNPARLTVLINPALTLSPVSQAVVRGGSVTFSAAFAGNPSPFGVQWRRGTVTLASNTVSGPLDFFALTNAQPADAGTWRVVVNNLASASGVQTTFTLSVLADSDGDGLPDNWELAHGLATNNPADAMMDIDADGSSNRDEYNAGTNPTNASSLLKIQAIALTNEVTASMLTFLAMSNKTYTALAREAVTQGDWSRVADVPATSTNRVVSIVDPSQPISNRFYRLITPRSR